MCQFIPKTRTLKSNWMVGSPYPLLSEANHNYSFKPIPSTTGVLITNQPVSATFDFGTETNGLVKVFVWLQSPNTNIVINDFKTNLPNTDFTHFVCNNTNKIQFETDQALQTAMFDFFSHKLSRRERFYSQFSIKRLLSSQFQLYE
jgi:hypothetical protein